MIALGGSSVTRASVTPGAAFSSLVTLLTQPMQVMPLTVSVAVSMVYLRLISAVFNGFQRLSSSALPTTDIDDIAVHQHHADAEHVIGGDAVFQALKRLGIEAEAFDPSDRDIEEIKTYNRVFIALHGRGGEDGSMQAFFAANSNFTCSNSMNLSSHGNQTFT